MPNKKFSFEGYAKILITSELSENTKKSFGLEEQVCHTQITFDSIDSNGKPSVLIVPTKYISLGELGLIVPQAYEQNSGIKVSFEEFDLNSCCKKKDDIDFTGGWLKLPPEFEKDTTLVYLTGFNGKVPLSPLIGDKFLGRVQIKKLDNTALYPTEFTLRLDSSATLIDLINRQSEGLNAYRITDIRAKKVSYTAPFFSD